VAGNGGVTLRTRRWIKTLKLTVPGHYRALRFRLECRVAIWRRQRVSGASSEALQ